MRGGAGAAAGSRAPDTLLRLLSSEIEVILWRLPSYLTTVTKPFFVQHPDIPKRCFAVTNASCLGLVRNSDKHLDLSWLTCVLSAVNTKDLNTLSWAALCEVGLVAGWNKICPTSWTQLGACKCGEDNSVHEWGWEPPGSSGTSWVVVSKDKKQVTFHSFFSTGTAAAEGNTPLHHNYHYYWEVKILRETYGTDIMEYHSTTCAAMVPCTSRYTRLIYAGSWRSSLLVDVAKILAALVKKIQERLPPGIFYTCRSQFWFSSF